jgi:hypothetical protein
VGVRFGTLPPSIVLLGGVVLKSTRARVAASVLLGVALLSACSSTRMLNTDDAQSAISKGLTEQIGSGTYTVVCPTDIEAKQGATFTCDVTADTGETAQVTATQDDDQGHFTWKVSSVASGAPSPAASPAAS